MLICIHLGSDYGSQPGACACPGVIMADIKIESPNLNLDVMLTVAAVAHGTKYIGLIATSLPGMPLLGRHRK